MHKQSITCFMHVGSHFHQSNRWWAFTTLAAVIVLVASVGSIGEVRAANGNPHGAMLEGMYASDLCGVSGAPSASQIQSWITDADVQLLRVGMLDSDCNDPAGLVPVLYPNGPVTTVVLEAGANQSDLYWNNIQNNFERKHGVFYNGQYWSYADLYNDFPNVTFYLEFGNEPDNFFGSSPNDGWQFRYQALATYKQLEHNACNNVAEAWDLKYPNLKWAIAAPASSLTYLQNEIQFESFQQNTPGCNDDLNAGGVRDYYDVVTPHLYSENTLPDGGTPTNQLTIYNDLVKDPYTKGIIVDEMGVHDGGGWPSKCSVLQNQVNTYLAPYAKVDGYAWFYLGGTNNTDWQTNYQIPNEADLAACSG